MTKINKLNKSIATGLIYMYIQLRTYLHVEQSFCKTPRENHMIYITFNSVPKS